MTACGTQPIRIGALISGGGRTLLNIIDHTERGELDAEIVCIIASREDIAGVEKLRARGFEVKIADRSAFDSDGAYHDQIMTWLRGARVDVVALCGWLRWLRIDPDFTGRVVNIHPALLPKFGGAGMYGNRVHQAVLDAGESESGCSVHWVDDIYDHGSVILQRRVPVEPGDTAESLAARVFEQECIAYPHALREIAAQLATP